MVMNNGTLVISLDFEMMWGCHDWATTDTYGISNVKQVRFVISELLGLFQKYDIHATFATVGLIFCKDKQEALLSKPSKLPSYENGNLCAYKLGYIESISDKDAELYFAPDVVEQLKKCVNIEIGTHTFSHYFCWEKGQSVEELSADLAQMNEIAERNGVKVESIVFPKNMVRNEYLKICKEYGLKVYRGNALKFFNQPKSKIDVIKNKIYRMLDAYFNVGGCMAYSPNIINWEENPVNIPASRLLRPYSVRLKWLEGLRLHRIIKEMEHAAKNGEIYHLWWHPHNFGSNPKENLEFLEKILKCYIDCHNKYGMQSCTMNEIVNKNK